MSYQFTLPPNATYLVRMGKWTVYTAAGFPVVGVLEVSESKRPGSAVRVRRYCIAEHPTPLAPETSSGVRFFKVTKPVRFGEGDPDPRFVHYHPTSVGDNSCTCEAFTKASNCVHVQCIRTLAGAGRLDAWVEPLPEPAPNVKPQAPRQRAGEGKPGRKTSS
jgi:hypothetical protein